MLSLCLRIYYLLIRYLRHACCSATSKLRITKSKEQDAGRYECSTENVMGKSPTVSINIRIDSGEPGIRTRLLFVSRYISGTQLLDHAPNPYSGVSAVNNCLERNSLLEHVCFRMPFYCTYAAASQVAILQRDFLYRWLFTQTSK
jgi:hypothetical protein